MRQTRKRDDTMNTRVLVLGASGMLGNAVFRLFSGRGELEVFGTVRSANILKYLPASLHEHLVVGVDVENADAITAVLTDLRPEMVVNCIGVVKQLASASDPLTAIPINSILPHRLAKLSALAGARFVQISTDCVFDGKQGNYREADFANANDLYGRSKLLGEVDYPNAITLRTSIIGHELNSNHSLVDWFLSQQGSVKGYRRAIFSGLPTNELARVIADFVIPRPELRGLYHVGAAAINKHELLQLIARQYGRDVEIIADDAVSIDRSLNADRFAAVTGYQAPPWPDLVRAMHAFG